MTLLNKFDEECIMEAICWSDKVDPTEYRIPTEGELNRINTLYAHELNGAFINVVDQIEYGNDDQGIKSGQGVGHPVFEYLETHKGIAVIGFNLWVQNTAPPVGKRRILFYEPVYAVKLWSRKIVYVTLNGRCHKKVYFCMVDSYRDVYHWESQKRGLWIEKNGSIV
jgi:hypothetical protein